ncbi:MAG: hypothetical protein CMJ78_16960 [Planctomycetaceae bacterium]|nr:hypothetical protein [Planctomycetaceae bacterium]
MFRTSRRQILRLGLSSTALSQWGSFSTIAAAESSERVGDSTFGRARNVIVMFCWGGMSHLDTFDMKPLAGSDVRGEFNSIATTIPGYYISEHLPLMARQMHHLAVVRSVHHGSADHRKAAYWNLTGHSPTNAAGGVVAPQLPSRKDWPSIGAQVAIAMRNDARFHQRKNVQRVRPEDVVEHERLLEAPGVKVLRRVSLSTDVLGPGMYSPGTFNKQDGYTNKSTVELIGMISKAAASSAPLTRQSDGPTADVSRFVIGDSTAGQWGSDTHGRGGPLCLVGDGEPAEAHAGFGCHANKFITFNLLEVRKQHFAGTNRPLALTLKVGMNRFAGMPPTAAGMGSIWIDGKEAAVSEVLSRDYKSQTIEAVIRPEAKFLTLAMLNGDRSTNYDDIALRDVNLHEVEGELPEQIEEETPKSKAVDKNLAANLPRTISIPYPLADRGLLNGQFGGFLGLEYDPVFVHPGAGTSFKGISPASGTIDLTPRVSQRRLAERGLLLEGLDHNFEWARDDEHASFRHKASHDQAVNMLLSPEVQSAFDLTEESENMHDLYGDHVAGKSTLLARRLADAGVPLVTVNLSVGDLNGASGDNWDTHGNNFNRLKNDLLPRWDRAASALIQDLVQSGRIESTLVVFLTEFGRTPKINGGAGRDHFPSCYTVSFAGAGVNGGSILGKSDKTGSKPIEAACMPKDIHATVFHSLGIDPHFEIHDQEDRPFRMCEGRPLPIFS